MTLFVPLDVEFSADPKIIRAGCNAELLFIRSLALAKRTMSDGAIDTVQLPMLALGIPGRPATHAGTLVLVGLWSKTETGWQIVAWTKRNKSRAEIEKKTEQRHRAGVKANHDRWHTSDLRSDSCPFCYPNRIGNRIVNGVRPESTESESESESDMGVTCAAADGSTRTRRPQQQQHGNIENFPLVGIAYRTENDLP